MWGITSTLAGSRSTSVMVHTGHGHPYHFAQQYICCANKRLRRCAWLCMAFLLALKLGHDKLRKSCFVRTFASMPWLGHNPYQHRDLVMVTINAAIHFA